MDMAGAGGSARRKKRGNNFESMQQSNRALVLQLIKAAGVSTRKSLAEQSGLQPATISIIVAELLERRLVEETGLVEGDCGRRLTGLRLRRDRYCTAAVRITPSYYAVGLYDINSACLAVEKNVWPFFEDIAASLQRVLTAVRRFLALRPDLHPLGAALAVQGDFWFDNGRCTMPGFEGEAGRDLCGWLSRALGIPVSADLAADYGAYHFSALPDYAYLQQEVFLNVLVSDTVDYSILDHGHIFRGALGVPGSLGRLIVLDGAGRPTPLEELCGNTVLLRRAAALARTRSDSALAGWEPLRSRDLINAFYAGDPIAVELYGGAAAALAQALAVLIRLLHPHRIFLSDEIPQNEGFLSLVRRALAREIGPRLLEKVRLCAPSGERSTARDGAMIGGSMYLTDRSIRELRL